MMLSHEAPNSSNRTVLPQPHNLASILNTVVLESLQRNGLTTTLHLLGLGENLFFPLLTPSAKTEHEMKSRFLLDVVVRKGATILELFTSEDKTLLIRGDALLVLDLRLDIVDGVRGLNIEGDGFACVILFIYHDSGAKTLTRCVPADGTGKDKSHGGEQFHEENELASVCGGIRLGDRSGVSHGQDAK